MADLTTLQVRLTEAELAYHKLMTGAAEVTVQILDQRITYNETNADKLAAYIDRLRAEIMTAGGVISGSPRRGIEVDL
jgi:hypothetical protein